MTKRNTLAILILSFALTAGIFVPCSSLAQDTPPHHFASLHFLHPLATSPDPETTTSFRLSILYGRSGGVRGLDLNAVAGVTSGDVTGLQLSGLYSRTGGVFSGVTGTLGLNNVVGGSSGVLIAGLANYNQDAFTGLQAAGVLNYTNRGFAGAQVSSVLNLNDGAGTFLQLSSLANVNAGPFAGFQLSALMNAANSSISGGQLALLNFGKDMSGVQVGLINMADRFHGLRIGVVNTGNEITGTTIGLINRDLDSRKEWMFYGASHSLVNIGFRTVLNHWSSVVSVGYGDAQGDVGEALFLGWNFGYTFLLNPRWDLTVDLGYQHVMPKVSNNPEENDRLHYALQARAMADYRLNEGLGLIGSVGVENIYSEYDSSADSEAKFHFSAGIVLY